MSRKFFSIVFAACIGIASIAASPATVSAFVPHDPGYTSTERIQVEAAVPAVTLRREEQTQERMRPTVVVYNLRTCAKRVPDSSGRLVAASSAHRTYAVPWLKC